MTLRIGSGRIDRVKSGQGEDKIRWISNKGSNRKMIGLARHGSISGFL